MKVKNIIIFSDFAHPYGGAGKVAFDVAIALKKNNYNVVFFSGTGPESSLFSEYDITSICLQQPDMASDPNVVKAAIRSIWNHKAYKMTIALLKEYNPSDTIAMVHGFSKTLSSSIFSAISKMNFKMIYILHDYFAACPNGGFYNYQSNNNCTLKPLSLKCVLCNCDVRNYPQKLYRCFRQLSVKHNLKSSKNVYAYNVSELSKKMMQPYIGTWFSCYDTLLNPIDLNIGQKAEISRNDTYVFMGRLSPEKGIQDFCRVITELSLKGVVLGEGYLKHELEVKYPNISFRGWVTGTDKTQTLLNAKCVVFPSKVHETFGLAIVEALSCGLPCIAPDGCGASFLIQDGVNGFLYPMGDYDSLKTAICKMEHLDFVQLEKGITKSFDPNLFTPETYIKNLEQIFAKIS